MSTPLDKKQSYVFMLRGPGGVESIGIREWSGVVWKTRRVVGYAEGFGDWSVN